MLIKTFSLLSVQYFSFVASCYVSSKHSSDVGPGASTSQLIPLHLPRIRGKSGSKVICIGVRNC